MKFFGESNNNTGGNNLPPKGESAMDALNRLLSSKPDESDKRKTRIHPSMGNVPDVPGGEALAGEAFNDAAKELHETVRKVSALMERVMPLATKAREDYDPLAVLALVKESRAIARELIASGDEITLSSLLTSGFMAMGTIMGEDDDAV